MEKLTTIGGHRVIINVQESKIGYSYPRLFIENGNEYINFDLSLPATFGMKKKDWDDWFEDAEEISTDAARKILEPLGVKWTALEGILFGLKEGE